MKTKIIFFSALLLLLPAVSVFAQPLMVYRLDPYLFDQGIYNNLTTKKGVEQTLKALQDKVTADPKDFAAQSDLGSIHFFLARYGEAASAFQKAIELAPPDKKVYYNLGMAYFAQGAYSEAQEAFKKRLEIDPKDNWSWGLLGVTYLMRKDYAPAQEALEKALALDAEMASVRVNLGGALYFLGKKDLAQKEFSIAAKTRSWPQAHYNLYLIYQEEGKNEEAARELEIYLASQSPSSPEYRTLNKEVERLRR